MNPVFWFLIILMLVAVWFSLRPVFKKIGNAVVNTVEDTKREMFEDKENNKK